MRELQSTSIQGFEACKNSKTPLYLKCILGTPICSESFRKLRELQRASEASERGYSARTDLSQKLFTQMQQGYKEIVWESFREPQSAATDDIEKLIQSCNF